MSRSYSLLFYTADFQHIGDMTIFRGQYEADEVRTRQERHVVVNSLAKWPGGVIPYEISSQFTSMFVDMGDCVSRR